MRQEQCVHRFLLSVTEANFEANNDGAAWSCDANVANVAVLVMAVVVAALSCDVRRYVEQKFRPKERSEGKADGSRTISTSASDSGRIDSSHRPTRERRRGRSEQWTNVEVIQVIVVFDSVVEEGFVVV